MLYEENCKIHCSENFTVKNGFLWKFWPLKKTPGNTAHSSQLYVYYALAESAMPWKAVHRIQLVYFFSTSFNFSEQKELSNRHAVSNSNMQLF